MIDLSSYVMILFETFSEVPDLDRGPWRGTHRWDNLIFNSERSFHAHPGLSLSGSVPPIDLQPFAVNDDVLSITPAPIPEARMPDVRALLSASGADAEQIEDVTHYTGMLSLHDSWAETYGYFEIRARVPGASGYWPAFWLSPGTKGWPPEIDIFEIDARGRDGPPVDEFAATVHFDAIDPQGNVIENARITNPFAGSIAPQQPVERQTPNGPRWSLKKVVDTASTGADLAAEFHVWGLEWTPSEIVWYFGKTAASLEEVYRTPTPPDLHSALYAIANVEVGGIMAGDVPPEGPRRDSFEIDYIKVFARHPEHRITADPGQADLLRGTDGPDHIMGSDEDDIIVPGTGFDIIVPGAGRDVIRLARDDGNAVIVGFGPEDRLELSGYLRSPLELCEDSLWVGNDLWIRDPGKPFYPRTLILRDLGARKIDCSQITELD